MEYFAWGQHLKMAHRRDKSSFENGSGRGTSVASAHGPFLLYDPPPPPRILAKKSPQEALDMGGRGHGIICWGGSALIILYVAFAQ